MTEHYFTEKPSSEHNYQEIDYQIPKSNENLKLRTDRGVFSKNKVDSGSNLLVESVSVQDEEKVLDIGCGYGVIGLSLAKKANIKLTMIDINSRAIELANYNAKINGIKANIYQSDGLSLVTEKFDKIVFNPPIRAGKDVYYQIIEQAKDYLFVGGQIYIVIQKKQGAKSMIKHLEKVFGNCEKINRSGGYWILQSHK